MSETRTGTEQKVNSVILRLHVAATWFELPFCRSIYALPVSLPAAFHPVHTGMLLAQHVKNEPRRGDRFALVDTSSHWSHEAAADREKGSAVLIRLTNELHFGLSRLDLGNGIRAH